jgi:Domain of unknown function (DUF4145)
VAEEAITARNSSKGSSISSLRPALAPPSEFGPSFLASQLRHCPLLALSDWWRCWCHGASVGSAERLHCCAVQRSMLRSYSPLKSYGSLSCPAANRERVLVVHSVLLSKPFHSPLGAWTGVTGIAHTAFECGYCGNRVGSGSGSQLVNQTPGAPGGSIAWIRICPECNGPNVFGPVGRVPGIPFGDHVPHLPEGLEKLYEEARASASANAYTAAVLVCRKMLMNIAVAEGAKEGKKFIEYVEHLSAKGFVPPNGTAWVDYIRKRGNEATHEIELMTEPDAKALIIFVEMLLRFIYEFPQLVPAPTASEGSS